MFKKLVVCLVVCFIAFLGCIGGGSGNVAQPTDNLGTIYGNIIVEAGLASLKSHTKSLSMVSYNNVTLCLEEKPLITGVTNADGSFSISGIPFGSYHLIARLDSAEEVYKSRSLNPAVLSSDSPSAKVNLTITQADKAEYTLRLSVNSPDSTPVLNCFPVLWGESFTFCGNGIYISPLMPLSAQGPLYIDPPPGTGWKQIIVPISNGLFKKDDLVVMGTRFVERGSVNNPPAVWVQGPFRPPSGSGSISLSADVYDPEDDLLNTSWSSNNGYFALVGSFSATWIAPSNAATSTITFKAAEIESRGVPLSAQTQFVIHVVNSPENYVPGEITLLAPLKAAEIISTATDQILNDTDIEFIASITWPCDVTPSIFWSVSEGAPTEVSSEHSFIWHSPHVDDEEISRVTITLLVTDGVDKITKSLKLTVLPMF